MVARLKSITFDGIEAVPIEVEVDVAARGLAGTTLVGLPDAAVKESVERVRTALRNSGYRFPRFKTVINLAPADLRKEGPMFDLPIALGVLFAGGEVLPSEEHLAQYLIAGELALDGRVRPIRGALSAALLAKRSGLRGILLPRENAPEAAVVDDIEAYPVSSFTEAVGFLTGQLPLEPISVDLDSIMADASAYDCDFADVRGQEHVKRALAIVAAGMHNVLLVGPPGTGKTMLAKRLPTILPPLTLEESLETTRIHSVAGQLAPGQALLATRPVRAPHHTASTPALVGGGSVPQAGEVSLAHHGVLFLDEFPEFARATMESLRQPLEDGCITIARTHTTVRFPAAFVLVAAMNPCPCGYFTDPRKPCKCTTPQIDKYLARISGPLLDRIDMHIEVPAVSFRQMRDERDGISSAAMRGQVMSARSRQQRRFKGRASMFNGRMGPAEIRKFCKLDSQGELVLKQAVTELGLSARAHDKVLRLGRTIADLADSDDIQPDHVSEAIHYRRLDRQL